MRGDVVIPARDRGADLPPAVRLVRDLVNTVSWQEDDDAWTDPAALAGWCDARLGIATGRLDDHDLALAKRLREGIRSVLLAHAGHDPLPAALADLDAVLAVLPLRFAVGAGGELGLRAADADGPRIAAALGVVLDAVDVARRDGDWVRLKACSRETCRWAYWDDSRNRSARWCSMEGCGNYVKMRTRNRGGAVDGDAIPRSGAHRPATMVDVAALAGVSVKTVSNVVTGAVPVSDLRRRRVEVAIGELGYVPDPVARALRSRRRSDADGDDGR